MFVMGYRNNSRIDAGMICWDISFRVGCILCGIYPGGWIGIYPVGLVGRFLEK